MFLSVTNYPGHPGYVPPAASTTTPSVIFASLPDATYTPPSLNTIASLPLASNSRSDCSLYVAGSDFQIDISTTLYGSVCEALAVGWGISLEELGYWNPSLNTSLPSCHLDPAYRYCAVWYDTTPSPAVTSEPAALPIRVS